MFCHEIITERAQLSVQLTSRERNENKILFPIHQIRFRAKIRTSVTFCSSPSVALHVWIIQKLKLYNDEVARSFMTKIEKQENHLYAVKKKKDLPQDCKTLGVSARGQDEAYFVHV